MGHRSDVDRGARGGRCHLGHRQRNRRASRDPMSEKRDKPFGALAINPRYKGAKLTPIKRLHSRFPTLRRTQEGGTHRDRSIPSAR